MNKATLSAIAHDNMRRCARTFKGAAELLTGLAIESVAELVKLFPAQNTNASPLLVLRTCARELSELAELAMHFGERFSTVVCRPKRREGKILPDAVALPERSMAYYNTSKSLFVRWRTANIAATELEHDGLRLHDLHCEYCALCREGERVGTLLELLEKLTHALRESRAELFQDADWVTFRKIIDSVRELHRKEFTRFAHEGDYEDTSLFDLKLLLYEGLPDSIGGDVCDEGRSGGPSAATGILQMDQPTQSKSGLALVGEQSRQSRIIPCPSTSRGSHEGAIVSAQVARVMAWKEDTIDPQEPDTQFQVIEESEIFGCWLESQQLPEQQRADYRAAWLVCHLMGRQFPIVKGEWDGTRQTTAVYAKVMDQLHRLNSLVEIIYVGKARLQKKPSSMCRSVKRAIDNLAPSRSSQPASTCRLKDLDRHPMSIRPDDR